MNSPSTRVLGPFRRIGARGAREFPRAGRRELSHQGFTLFELIVVIGVISVLVAILTPRVMVYLDDASVIRARADANAIAAAVDKMYEETGRWPFYADGKGALKFNAATDFALLSSNPACNGAAVPPPACDDDNPADGTTGATWHLGTARTDSIRHHLVLNAPGNEPAKGYRTTGPQAWDGPYLYRIPEVDPWGRSFLINVGNADPDAEGVGVQKWVIVISAGPDGELDTRADVLTTGDVIAGLPVALDDDIIANVK
jgi:prepilin-type N-terminal cleavage/methylation domain-containing protein